MKQLKIITELEKLISETDSDYINNEEEKYFGRRSQNLHTNIVEVSQAMNTYPKLTPEEIASKMFELALQRDYWYKFTKEWE
jgi:Tat protein secretion system quality control protein TatD with DNase activity